MSERIEKFEVIEGSVCELREDKFMPVSDTYARETQMVNLAVNLAEQQLRDGTASQGVIIHYLKLGTERDRMEREVLEKQIKLLSAKTDQIELSKANEGLYHKAIEAMKTYGSSS